jgi:hypothetical protein
MANRPKIDPLFGFMLIALVTLVIGLLLTNQDARMALMLR